MIADNAWVTQGIWGDENTPDITEVIVVSAELSYLLHYVQGLFLEAKEA